MNLRAILLVALCAAIATCAYFFLAGETTVSTKTLGPSADSSSGASSGKPTPGNPQPADGAEKNPAAAKQTKVDWKFLKSLEGNFSTPNAAPADIERFLAKNAVSDKFHEEVCKAPKQASVTATCKKEGDKLVLTASKAEVTK